MNGGAIRATLIGFKLNNTSKMRNPTLVMRETRRCCENCFWRALFFKQNFSACLDAAVSEFGSRIFT